MKDIAARIRPNSFSEVVGQDKAIESILEAINNGSKCFLFHGISGVGKTTCAKILAMYINCSNTNKPCTECKSCKSFLGGYNPDITEIDAASHSGVDDIRSLILSLRYAPENKERVVILDEAHMLSTAACNALLKTLEDSIATFILCTTRIDKILNTVQNRCSCIEFIPVKETDITTLLTNMFPERDKTLIETYARHSNGSVRKAIKLCSQGNEHPISSIDGIISSLLDNNINKALEIRRDEDFMEDMLRYFQNKMISDTRKPFPREALRITLEHIQLCKGLPPHIEHTAHDLYLIDLFTLADKISNNQ